MSNVLDKMVEILSNEIGAITARASISMYAEKMGLTLEAIEPQHVSTLVEKLKPGLTVFVGAGKTEHLAKLMMELGKASQ